MGSEGGRTRPKAPKADERPAKGRSADTSGSGRIPKAPKGAAAVPAKKSGGLQGLKTAGSSVGGPASKRALRSQGRQTMQKLLEAAMVAFDQRGYHATRVSDIVDIANMSHGTFYLYFANMNDLVRALTAEAAMDASELYGALTEAGTALAGETRDELRKWIGDYSKMWLRYAPLFRSWTDLADVDEAVGRRIRHTLGTLTDAMALRIAAGGHAGDLNPEVTGMAVLAMLDRFHYLRDFIGQPVDEDALDTLTTMIYRAVFTAPDGGSPG